MVRRLWVVAAMAVAVASAASGCATAARPRALSRSPVPGPASPSAPATSAQPAHRDFQVPAGLRLYGAARRWVALTDISGEPGDERIVLVDTRTGRRHIVLPHAVTRSPRLGVADVAVADAWVAWEEVQPYDIELGAAARWRIMTAPIKSGPRLGTAVEAAAGIVGRRPRCAMTWTGRGLVLGLTEVSCRDRSTGRPLTATSRVEVFDPATRTRSVVATFPGLIDALAEAPDGLVVCCGDAAGRHPRNRVVRLGWNGSRTEWVLPPGAETVRDPAAGPDWTAVAVAEAPGSEPRLTVFDRRLRPRWMLEPGTGDPVATGGRIAYRSARPVGPVATGPASAVLLLDPATGARTELARSDVTENGVWLLAGEAPSFGPLWAMFSSSVEASEAGRPGPFIRRFDLR